MEDMLGYIARCALAHDTQVSRAFLRALGMDASLAGTRARAPERRAHASHGVFDGLDACRMQRHGVRL